MTRVMPYAGPAQAGTKVPSASVPTAHSISKVTRAFRPAAAVREAIWWAKAREHATCLVPSWVYLSAGAQAQPGCAASGVSLLRSGIRRKSPPGPPMCLLVVMLSSTTNTSNTGDIPMPHPATLSSRPIGMALTRVIPALSTQQTATRLTSAAARRCAASRPSAERLARSRVSSLASPEVCIVTEHLVWAGLWVFETLHTGPSVRQCVTGVPAILTAFHRGRANRRLPAAQVNRPHVDDIAVRADVCALVVCHRRVDVSGREPHLLADRQRRRERRVLVRAEPDGRVTGSREGWVAVIHAERLQPGIGDRPLALRCGDDRSENEQRLAERQPELAVGRVHQRVRTGLDLAGPGITRIGPGPARRDKVTADVGVRLDEQLHRGLSLARPIRRIGQAHHMALVPHDAADLQAGLPCEVGQLAGVDRIAAAARHPDVDVNHDLAHSPGRRGSHRRRRVNRHGDPGSAGDKRAEPARVEHLVGQQEVFAEPRGDHSLTLTN